MAKKKAGIAIPDDYAEVFESLKQSVFRGRAIPLDFCKSEFVPTVVGKLHCEAFIARTVRVSDPQLTKHSHIVGQDHVVSRAVKCTFVLLFKQKQPNSGPQSLKLQICRKLSWNDFSKFFLCDGIQYTSPSVFNEEVCK